MASLDRDDDWAQEEQSKIGEERSPEHNCEFIAYDETLIDSIKLFNMVAKDPLEKMGQVRWYKKPEQDKL